MYFREIISKEEKLLARETFLQTYKVAAIITAVRKTAGVLGLIICLYCLHGSRYTHNPLYFMLGLSCLPVFLYHLYDISHKYKRIKPLKKLKKPDRLFAETLMDEIVIDDEKITINESFSVYYKHIQTILFAKDFAVVIEKTAQPVIIKLSDERQIQLYRLLSDKKKSGRKINVFVTTADPKSGYHIPEIEAIRKPKAEKVNRKHRIITVVLLLVSVIYSVVYIKGHTVTDEELYPDIEYTYTEGEDLHTMLEKTVDIGNSIKPVIDIYSDYADSEFNTFIKTSTDSSGEKQITVCYFTGESEINIIQLTDNTEDKKRTVSYQQQTNREAYVRQLFEPDHVSKEYPLISDYMFWINDGWKITLKDDRLLTFNDEGIYRFSDNTASFTGKGEERFSVNLRKCGQKFVEGINELFGQLEQECRKPYDEQNIKFEAVEKEIRHYVLLGD